MKFVQSVAHATLTWNGTTAEMGTTQNDTFANEYLSRSEEDTTYCTAQSSGVMRYMTIYERLHPSHFSQSVMEMRRAWEV